MQRKSIGVRFNPEADASEAFEVVEIDLAGSIEWRHGKVVSRHSSLEEANRAAGIASNPRWRAWDNP